MGYRRALLGHLAEYKSAVLGIHEDGVWRRSGKTYPHILPEAQANRNLLDPICEPCLDYLKAGKKKLHRDFPHLNSSQAFALNLFFPFLQDVGGRSALLAALKVTGSIKSWDFEAVPWPAEGTNFDLMLSLSHGPRVYIEVKLTESGFGRARPNDLRSKKLTTIYRPRLMDKVPPAILEELAFFDRYQLLRNLCYVDEPAGSTLLLVFPNRNLEARSEADDFLRLVGPLLAERVRVVFAEDLAAALLAGAQEPSAAADVLRLVIEKYALVGGSLPSA